MQLMAENTRLMVERNRPPMPRPGTTGAPYFDGTNITKFIDDWEGSIKAYGQNITASDSIPQLPRYCSDDIAVEIKIVDGFDEKDWDQLKSAIETATLRGFAKPWEKIEMPEWSNTAPMERE